MDWTEDARFLEYVVLFDRREFFRAHEVLEEQWMETQGDDRSFLQGLIQLAVCLEHAARGKKGSALKVLDRARLRFEPYGARHAGVEVALLVGSIADYIVGVAPEPPRFPMHEGSRGHG